DGFAHLPDLLARAASASCPARSSSIAAVRTGWVRAVSRSAATWAERSQAAEARRDASTSGRTSTATTRPCRVIETSSPAATRSSWAGSVWRAWLTLILRIPELYIRVRGCTPASCRALPQPFRSRGGHVRRQAGGQQMPARKAAGSAALGDEIIDAHPLPPGVMHQARHFLHVPLARFPPERDLHDGLFGDAGHREQDGQFRMTLVRNGSLLEHGLDQQHGHREHLAVRRWVGH